MAIVVGTSIILRSCRLFASFLLMNQSICLSNKLPLKIRPTVRLYSPAKANKDHTYTKAIPKQLSQPQKPTKQTPPTSPTPPKTPPPKLPPPQQPPPPPHTTT